MYSGLHGSRDWNPGVGSRVCVFNYEAAPRSTEGRRFVHSPVTGDRPWFGIRLWVSGPLELLTSWPSYLMSPCSPRSTVPLPPLHAELPGCLGTLGTEEAEPGSYPWGCADGVVKTRV